MTTLSRGLSEAKPWRVSQVCCSTCSAVSLWLALRFSSFLTQSLASAETLGQGAVLKSRSAFSTILKISSSALQHSPAQLKSFWLAAQHLLLVMQNLCGDVLPCTQVFSSALHHSPAQLAKRGRFRETLACCQIFNLSVQICPCSADTTAD